MARETPPLLAAMRLGKSKRPLSPFEFWPAKLFYLPVKLHAIWLALRYGGPTLPVLANPTFDFGGFVGESKLQILDLLPSSLGALILPYASLSRSGTDESAVANDTDAVLQAVSEAGFGFPFIAKPDKGSRGAGVRRITDRTALESYINSFPECEAIVFQELQDLPFEAGIFYLRQPENDPGTLLDSATGSTTDGQIFSVTLKIFPYVTGNGRSTLRELIHSDPRACRLEHLYLPRHEERLDRVIGEGAHIRLAFAGSHARGCIFRDGSHLITPAFTRQWDLISRQIPGFHFGRFDIRFDDIRQLSCVNAVEDLQTLEGVKLIEVNGAGSEATHIWDADMTLGRAWSTLFSQYRWLFRIGAAQRRLGHKGASLKALWAEIERNEAMAEQYPQTE